MTTFWFATAVLVALTVAFAVLSLDEVIEERALVGRANDAEVATRIEFGVGAVGIPGAGGVMTAGDTVTAAVGFLGERVRRCVVVLAEAASPSSAEAAAARVEAAFFVPAVSESSAP
ncbi:hypothetical protein [Mycolicibacterium gilvum]|uniref:hypothetical protein n=1 Tax=Mycolicibacterium gilvum TaxID=1804 RepID=UPI001FD330FC|nr:hypothetical protein [Mycolicibacterium gilvum]